MSSKVKVSDNGIAINHDKYGRAKSGIYGTSIATNEGIAFAGNYGTAITFNWGASFAGRQGTAISGDNGESVVCFGGKASSGIDGELYFKDNFGVGHKFFVGENGILPNRLYKLNEDGQLVLV